MSFIVGNITSISFVVGALAILQKYIEFGVRVSIRCKERSYSTGVNMQINYLHNDEEIDTCLLRPSYNRLFVNLPTPDTPLGCPKVITAID